MTSPFPPGGSPSPPCPPPWAATIRHTGATQWRSIGGQSMHCNLSHCKASDIIAAQCNMKMGNSALQWTMLQCNGELQCCEAWVQCSGKSTLWRLPACLSLSYFHTHSTQLDNSDADKYKRRSRTIYYPRLQLALGFNFNTMDCGRNENWPWTIQLIRSDTHDAALCCVIM